MKKIILFAMLLTGIVLSSCSKDEDNIETSGSIYGIVTRTNSTEVLKGIQVKLYIMDPYTANWNLLLSTTTFEDGHYEFSNLNSGKYGVAIGNSPLIDWWLNKVVLYVNVEPGRQARVDIQIDDDK